MLTALAPSSIGVNKDLVDDLNKNVTSKTGGSGGGNSGGSGGGGGDGGHSLTQLESPPPTTHSLTHAHTHHAHQQSGGQPSLANLDAQPSNTHRPSDVSIFSWCHHTPLIYSGNTFDKPLMPLWYTP
nr:uncharacterized protein LOC128698441 [Cherax quadricarinatus]